MADIFDAASSMIDRVLSAGGREVSYARGSGGPPITISAVIGSSEAEQIDVNGLPIDATVRDYIFSASDLDFGDGAVVPEKGDVITDTLDGVERSFKVIPGLDRQAFEYPDPQRRRIRVHTMEVQP